jgi:hypothetical protein
MSKTVYLLFVHLAEGAFCAGVYDSSEKCDAEIARISEEIGEEIEDEDVEIVETQINQLVTHPVVEFGDEDGEEEA